MENKLILVTLFGDQWDIELYIAVPSTWKSFMNYGMDGIFLIHYITCLSNMRGTDT